MSVLYWIAYASWALAAFSVMIGLTDGGFEFFIIAISIAISGVLFFAFGKVISLLGDIRDALTGSASDSPIQEPVTGAVEAKPSRSIEEISADLDRLKSNRAQV